MSERVPTIMIDFDTRSSLNSVTYMPPLDNQSMEPGTGQSFNTCLNWEHKTYTGANSALKHGPNIHQDLESSH